MQSSGINNNASLIRRCVDGASMIDWIIDGSRNRYKLLLKHITAINQWCY
jgi:hypothetical protein